MAGSSSHGAANRYERRRQQNRAALIAAALELFQRQGLRGTKVEEICERADVATRTFFNHFETREHLYEAIAEQRASQLAAIFDAASEADGALAERLLGIFRRIGAYLTRRPAYRELVGTMLHLQVDGGSEVARSRSIGRAALHFIETAIARGQIPRRHSPEVLADILVGALTTALVNWCASDAYDLDEELVSAAHALLDLFAPGAGDQPAASRTEIP